MSVKLRSRTGSLVEASESNAKRLCAEHGWKYLEEDQEPAEAVSEPVAPKKRGRPKKVNND